MNHSVPFGITLTQHALKQGAANPQLGPQYSTLMTQIGVAGKLIAAQVRRAGLIEIWRKQMKSTFKENAYKSSTESRMTP